MMDQNLFDVHPFSYRISKSGKVFISWQGKQVKTLAGLEAQRFIDKINQMDSQFVQLMMAKVTGNFKRGNERLAFKASNERNNSCA